MCNNNSSVIVLNSFKQYIELVSLTTTIARRVAWCLVYILIARKDATPRLELANRKFERLHVYETFLEDEFGGVEFFRFGTSFWWGTSRFGPRKNFCSFLKTGWGCWLGTSFKWFSFSIIEALTNFSEHLGWSWLNYAGFAIICYKFFKWREFHQAWRIDQFYVLRRPRMSWICIFLLWWIVLKELKVWHKRSKLWCQFFYQFNISDWRPLCRILVNFASL